MSKPLLPTLRERNRYMVFEIISDGKFSKKDVSNAIWHHSLKFLGENGVGKSSLWLIDWNESEQKGILKVNHLSVDNIRAALALIKSINGENCIPHVLGISGTIKSAREKFLN